MKFQSPEQMDRENAELKEQEKAADAEDSYNLESTIPFNPIGELIEVSCVCLKKCQLNQIRDGKSRRLFYVKMFLFPRCIQERKMKLPFLKSGASFTDGMITNGKNEALEI